jgi:hypothetical protein
MCDKFYINLDLYERVTAIRRAVGLPSSDYLERVKKSVRDKSKFVVNGEVVWIRREN